jgi:heptosyltransferase-2
MRKILVIQTAFIGDVVLSTALLESLHNQFPQANIDVLVRKGNESLFTSHPFIHEVLVWVKKENKYFNWLKILFKIRKAQYDVVVNVQRYAATGLWTAFSNASIRVGFDKNPFSFLFSHKVKHVGMQVGLHEINKNHSLLTAFAPCSISLPKLYPTTENFEKIKPLQATPYICIAPASVWFTKQYPVKKWIDFLQQLPIHVKIYLLGGSGDQQICQEIKEAVTHLEVSNMAGNLSFLESAALQKGAIMNYVNDSAPMHFCSAVNAPVAAVYCSTIPDFGYGPLSEASFVIQTIQSLSCRPCGIHGKKSCPLGHFNCANFIQLEQLNNPLSQMG